MIGGAIAVAAVALGVAWRARRISALTALSMGRRPLAATGIVIGGESITLEHPNAPAILIIHGAGDTPQTVRYLADELYARGYHVVAPLLPGHGRHVREFRHVSADVWRDFVTESYTALATTHPWAGVVGISMGGALAVDLAARTPAMPALALVAPYLAMPRRIERAAQLSWLWGIATPIVRSSEGLSILDPAERERNLAYGVFTASALRALRTTVRRAAAALPHVQAPTLVIQSREDNRIAPVAAEQAFNSLGAAERRLEWISGAAHIITVDYGRQFVIEAVIDWMETHGAGASITS